MSTLLQQNSLINFVVSHPSGCDCRQCSEIGGYERLFEIYDAYFFTDLDLRRVWCWLIAKSKQGTCQFSKLDFANDPTAPKVSVVTGCMTDSDGNLIKVLLD